MADYYSYEMRVEVVKKIIPCIIATAVYGTPFNEKIEVLRRFRDKRLMTNPIGRLFVKIYYGLSKRIAFKIAEKKRLKMLLANLINVLVKMIEVLKIA